MIVNGIDITKKYSIQEVTEMYMSGKYRDVVLHGYVARADNTGLIGFAPVAQSSLARSEAGKLIHRDWDAEAMRQDVEREHPIVRTSPLAKTERMQRRIQASGITEEVGRAVLGAAWKAGHALTAEDAKAVAAHFLGLGENTNKEADSHRITRAHKT